MKILIIYGSLEGQTEKISNRIAELIRDQNHHITTLSGDNLPPDFSKNDYDAVIIGGSIHMNKYPLCISNFVSKNRDWLNNVPSAFFTVCMAIDSKRAKSKEQAIRYGQNFLAQTEWNPIFSETFAGAVKYTKYSFIIRFIMKLISMREGGSTDTSQDHEYTNWESVERFTENFLINITR